MSGFNLHSLHRHGYWLVWETLDTPRPVNLAIGVRNMRCPQHAVSATCGPRTGPRQMKDRYRELCEFLPWGYLVVDEQSGIEHMNAAAARLLGSPRRGRARLLQEYFPEGTLLDALARSTVALQELELPLRLPARESLS